MKLFENVTESFLHRIPRDKSLDDLERALACTSLDERGAVIAQIAVIEGKEDTYRVTGAWFPPEIADKILAVIDEWRELKGIPRKSA